MTGYINVPSEVVEDRSSPYGCYAGPPTPPPFHQNPFTLENNQEHCNLSVNKT